MNYLFLSILTLTLPFAAADSLPVSDPDPMLWDPHRIDSHAPIGVMAEHTHNAGEWMLSYRFMSMHMDGMRQGSDSLSSQEVFDQGFLVTPTVMDMEMHMHMFGMMVAPQDWLTLMVMA
ncbi:MAG: transporter, partial [Verrucomicrobiota bacterium]